MKTDRPTDRPTNRPTDRQTYRPSPRCFVATPKHKNIDGERDRTKEKAPTKGSQGRTMEKVEAKEGEDETDGDGH